MAVRAVLSVAAFLCLALPATASVVEDATGGAVAYQFDGGTHHDAPDACADAAPAWGLAVGGSADGLLAPPEDSVDVYRLEVPAGLVGARLDVQVRVPVGMPEVALDTLAPGCAGSVLDVVNWPTPEPSPPAPGAGERQVSADVRSPWHCEGRQRQWVFGLDGLAGLPAPAAIHVAWTDGSERTVALSSRSGAYAAYRSGEALATTLKGAWANLPAAWSGRFAFVVGPCDATDGGAVYGPAPTLSAGRIAFTPVRPGPYVVQLTLAPPQAPSLVAPASCHYCVGGVEEATDGIGYNVSAERRNDGHRA